MVQPTLAAELRASWQLQLSVIWNMECGIGPVRGFTDEAITFATALEGHIDLRLETSDPYACDQQVLRHLPRATREAVMRMQGRPLERSGAVLIVHRDPGRYRHFVSGGRLGALYSHGHGGGYGGYDGLSHDRWREHWHYDDDWHDEWQDDPWRNDDWQWDRSDEEERREERREEGREERREEPAFGVVAHDESARTRVEGGHSTGAGAAAEGLASGRDGERARTQGGASPIGNLEEVSPIGNLERGAAVSSQSPVTVLEESAEAAPEEFPQAANSEDAAGEVEGTLLQGAADGGREADLWPSLDRDITLGAHLEGGGYGAYDPSNLARSGRPHPSGRRPLAPTGPLSAAEVPHPKPVYIIGRSMFETSAVPSDWPDACNRWVDEIWLPSEFNRHTFSAHGVEHGRLHVMPQPIDTSLFNAQTTTAMVLAAGLPVAASPAIALSVAAAPQQRPRSSGAAPFAFLSVFKWEARKGWDVLLRAYLEEFAGDGADDVVLYLRVSTDEHNRRDLANHMVSVLCDATGGGAEAAQPVEAAPPVEAAQPMEAAPPVEAAPPMEGVGTAAAQATRTSTEASAAARTILYSDSAQHPIDESPAVVPPTTTATTTTTAAGPCVSSAAGVRRAPPVVLLDEAVSQAELPGLYKAVDAFVLPTRGEGWGRPAMEAMAMGLPTIVTNYSGTTAFMSSANAYPLPFEMVAAPTGEGHEWAEPSIGALRALMRRVTTHRAEAADIGAAAASHIHAHFSQEAVADQMLRRLGHLQPTLLERRQEAREARVVAAREARDREARNREARKARRKPVAHDINLERLPLSLDY